MTVRSDEVVREVERAANAACDIGSERLWHRPPHVAMPIDDAAQRRPGNELHRDEIVSRYFAELIDLDDVAVEQVRGELRFVDEELKEFRPLRVMRMNDLERDSFRET